MIACSGDTTCQTHRPACSIYCSTGAHPTAAPPCTGCSTGAPPSSEPPNPMRTRPRPRNPKHPATIRHRAVVGGGSSGQSWEAAVACPSASTTRPTQPCTGDQGRGRPASPPIIAIIIIGHATVKSTSCSSRGALATALWGHPTAPRATRCDNNVRHRTALPTPHPRQPVQAPPLRGQPPPPLGQPPLQQGQPPPQ